MSEALKKPDVLNQTSIPDLAENYSTKLIQRAGFAAGSNLHDSLDFISEFDVREALKRKIANGKDVAELKSASNTLLALFEQFTTAGSKRNFTEEMAEVGIVMHTLGERITSESLMQANNTALA